LCLSTRNLSPKPQRDILFCSKPNDSHRKTSLGDICVRAFCTPAEILSHQFEAQFKAYPQYKSIYTKRRSLEAFAAVEETNVTLALTPDQRIIGFGVLTFPEPEERWAQLGPGAMMEVKAIEVGRGWRGHKIANDILGRLLTHPRLEHMIVYMVGYSWTWDLDGTGLTAQQYRNMLIRLFSAHAFREFQTNEPNLCLKPENLFMGRVGIQVSDQMRKAFKWLCFGIS
jgi:acetoin utilization protein AcuA